MRYYFGILHKDADSAYGVHFPDLPGCFSAADSLEDVLANATESVALYLEGEENVPPRDLNDIQSDRDVQRELAEGGSLIAVPFIQLTGRSAKANITMDAGLLAAIDKVAKERHITRSAFLADLASREITGSGRDTKAS